MHDTALSLVIIQRIVVRAAIVPECQCAFVPADTAAEFRARHMVLEIMQEWSTFLDGHVFKMLSLIHI